MTYTVIDPLGRTLTSARAGHTPFIRVAGHGGAGRRADVFAPDGMVLGLNLDGGVRFERCLQELTLPVSCGDVFFFYTDGVSEAMDGNGECFGDDRLSARLEATSGARPEAIRDGLLEEVQEFTRGQPQHDDITMVILKVDR